MGWKSTVLVSACLTVAILAALGVLLFIAGTCSGEVEFEIPFLGHENCPE
jgi:hypothetical protein